MKCKRCRHFAIHKIAVPMCILVGLLTLANSAYATQNHWQYKYGFAPKVILLVDASGKILKELSSSSTDYYQKTSPSEVYDQQLREKATNLGLGFVRSISEWTSVGFTKSGNYAITHYGRIVQSPFPDYIVRLHDKEFRKQYGKYDAEFSRWGEMEQESNASSVSVYDNVGKEIFHQTYDHAIMKIDVDESTNPPAIVVR